MPRHPWTLLLAPLARVADAEELARRREHTSTEPDGEALHLVADDLTSIFCGWACLPSEPNLFTFASSLASTRFLTSLWSRRPKSLNIVDPPDRTMFLYKPRLVSMGHLTIDSSTTSGKGVKKSEEKISGLKKISGPKNRSYPTSATHGCFGAFMLPFVRSEIFGRVTVVLRELLGQVGANIRVHFFDAFRYFEGVLRGHRFSSLSQ